MPNIEGREQVRERSGVFQPGDHIRRSAQDRVAARDRPHELGRVLEAGAEDDWQTFGRVAAKCLEQCCAGEREAPARRRRPDGPRGVLARVGVDEQVDGERPQARALRRARERPRREGDDGEVEPVGAVT
ncbi:hypothetical protein EK403_04280 [Hansschlegelia zhihuaiae]|uniref:Uncharacterized protein n=1 Tax=Hansschlegelia zhihuaiae TaxID=405005 RepID=A0A4Q0MLL4_9HYPH|nr:hypothetical protein EK403_04280 [Hansschlegelia zhihuaiae]